MIHLSAKPRSRHHIIKSLLTVSFITIVAAVGFLMLTKPAHVAAADANGCTVPSGGGTDSFDATNTPTTSTSQGLDITSPGTYYLWMRMESPDGTHNTLSVSVNGGYCFAIGGTMAANTWTWENNVYGGQAAVFTLPAGDNTLVITGANGVSLDSWLLTQQSPSQCTPTGITSATDCEPALPVAIPYYLAAGATKDQTVNAGQSWNADTLSPTSSYVSGGTTDCQGGTISGPGDNQPIFDCERWDSGGGITYTIPVANGTYDLRLLFAEIYSGCDKVGCRVENVSVNSKTVISNLDVYKQVGANAAYYVDVPVTVSNNQIVVTFTTVTGNAKVSGLEILKNTPPSVAFTAPISGATVSGASVPVSAAASSSVGIQSVEFVNNFTPIATDTTAPYSATFDSTSVANGNYLLSVIATDINGNTFQTTEPITVDNQVCSTAPSAPTNVKDPDTTLSANKVDLSWTAVTAPTNCLLSGYNIYRGTSATNLTKIAGPVTTASYDDSTVAAGTTYYYQVTAVDNDTSASESAKSPTTPLSSTTAANCTSGNSSVPSTPVLTATGGISYTSIPLSWTASTVNNGCTLSGYHVYRTGDTTPIYSGPATSFTDTGTGLTPANLVSGTSYSYTIVAYDSGGNDSVAGSASATTEEDNQAPVLPANPTPSNITSGSVTLAWSASTDLPNPGGTGVGGYEVFRCTGANCSTFTTSNLVAKLPGTQLSYTDTSVSPSTSYDYVVIAYDKASPVNYDKTASATLIPATTQAAIANCTAAPSVPTLSQGTTTVTSIGLNWTASNPSSGCSITGYQVWQGSTEYSSYGASTTSATVTGLSPGKAYSFYVVALESSTLKSQSTTHSFSTTADTTPPSPVPSFTATNLNGAVTLSWQAATDNIGVADYVITRTGGSGGAKILPTVDYPATSTTDSSVSASTSYVYSIVAYDTSDNPGSAVTANITTPSPACSGTVSAPSTPVSSALTANGASFTWTATTPPNGCTIAGYRVFNGTTLISGTTLVSGTSYSATNLTPNTAYSFNVEEVDSANTASNPSGSLQETTSPVSTTAVPGDINGNGTVDFNDFSILVVNWDGLSKIPNFNNGAVATGGQAVTGDTAFDGQTVTSGNGFTLFSHFVVDWDAYDGT